MPVYEKAILPKPKLNPPDPVAYLMWKIEAAFIGFDAAVIREALQKLHDLVPIPIDPKLKSVYDILKSPM